VTRTYIFGHVSTSLRNFQGHLRHIPSRGIIVYGRGIASPSQDKERIAMKSPKMTKAGCNPSAAWWKPAFTQAQKIATEMGMVNDSSDVNRLRLGLVGVSDTTAFFQINGVCLIAGFIEVSI